MPTPKNSARYGNSVNHLTKCMLFWKTIKQFVVFQVSLDLIIFSFLDK